MSSTDQSKKAKNQKKQEAIDYIPSPGAYSGEIQVKGKTLGRWSVKNFILDPESKLFVLKRNNPKKKWKIFDLKKYTVEKQEKVKDRFSFELEPLQQGEKKLQLRTTNEKVYNNMIFSLSEMCPKLKGIAESGPMTTRSSVRKSMFEKDKIHYSQPASQHDSEEDETNPRNNPLPDHFNNLEILNHILDNYQEDLYKIDAQTDSMKVYRHKNSFTLYKATLVIDVNIPEYVIYNLITNYDYYQVINKFITPASRIVRPIQEEKSVLIHEQRKYKDLYPFPREFVFLRHSRFQNDRILIFDKSVDAIDVRADFVKGNIKLAIWKIYKSDDKLKLSLTYEGTNSGFTYPDEDGFFTSHYISELENLNAYLQKNYEAIMKDKVLTRNPFEIFEQQLQKKEQQEQQEDVPLRFEENRFDQEQLPTMNDEFYDCDEQEEILHERLHVESRESIYKEIGEPQEEPDAQPPINELEWMNWKMHLFQSGEYQYYNIKHRYPQAPDAKGESPMLLQLPEGVNFVYREDWLRDDTKGGLKMINQAKINAQKKVIKFLLKRIGSNILTGKSMMHVSMPVDIFEARSNTERICNALGFAPLFLERAAEKKDLVARLHDAYAFTVGYLVNFMSMDKPFNPILGETYQGYLDKCPVYAEQVSHHPPVTAFQLYGRGYKVEGRLETVASIHSNSVTGKNIGHITIKFSDQTIKCILAPGLITGTAFGDRVFWFTGKSFCMDIENQLILEAVHQPDKKFCQSIGANYNPIGDYLCGGIYKVNQSAIEKFYREGLKKYTGLDKADTKEILHRVEGRWTKDVYIDQNLIFDVLTHVPCCIQHEPYPLASDANYRLDLLWWKVRDFDSAQSNKEEMEVLQRFDRKLREKLGPKH